MTRDVRDHLADEVAFQGDACARLGSPLYGALMEHAAADARAGGIVAELLAPLADMPRGAGIVLRLFGTVHRLALTGNAPALARWYPSCGATDPVDVEAAWEAFVNVCRDQRTTVEAGLAQPPQTNEVGRGAGLRGGLDLVGAAAGGLPMRLVEIGASAGLNLRCDRFHLGTPDGGRGPAGSPVQLPDAWEGNVPPPVDLQVVERRGCDIAPIDPTTLEAALRLQSYVWPDQVERLARLRGAIAIAHDVPAEVVEGSAPDQLAELRPEPGVVTVVQHSVMWQYLADDDRVGAQAELDRLRDTATADAPVARVALEPRRRADDRDVDYGGLGFEVTVACWPHVAERVVARARPHGPPIRWL